MFRKFIATTIALLISGITQSANIQVEADRNGTVILHFSDEITAGDDQKFINIAKSWEKSGNPIQVVILNSGGGELFTSYRIADYLLKSNISTFVPNNALCASACVNIFLSGYPRVADINSRIGVHRVSENERDTLKAKGFSVRMNDFYRAMNVPREIRIAMIDTPPEDMYYLTHIEKQQISTFDINHNEAKILFDQSGLPKPVDTIPKNAAQIARKLNKEAIKLIWNNNFSVAISKLEQAKSYNPADAEVLGNLGFAYQQAGDLTNARINFTASLKLAPKRGATWGNLADVLADTGDIDWAAQAFVNYWNYSKNKQAATNLFYTWMNQYPNTGRDIAVRRAMQILGL